MASGNGVGSGAALKLAGLVVLTLVSLWLSVAVTTGLVYARRDPAIATAGWHSPTADAEKAATLVQQSQQAPDLAQAGTLAYRALRYDPLNVVAVRTLGLIAALGEHRDAAQRWFSVAQALSRRDLPTQLWLIEDAVQRGQIDSSLAHYAYALNTNRSAEPLLFPLLVAASGEPAINRPLAAIVRTRPLWGARFLDTLISTGTSPAGLMTLVGAAHLDVRKSDEQQLAARAIQRLFQINAEADAFALYRQLSGKLRDGVQNGDFQRSNPLPPFDWELADQPDIFAAITNGPDAQHPRALSLTSANGKGGVAAQQLLHVMPGTYMLSALAGGDRNDPATQPRLQVLCRGKSDGQLLDLPFPASASEHGILMRARVDVPLGCPFQQLQMVFPGMLDGGTSETWITDVTLQSH